MIRSKPTLTCLLIALLVAASPRAAPAASERGVGRVPIKEPSGQQVGLYRGSYALLVGVSDYRVGWPDLSAVPGELAEVERALSAKGFQVVKVLDPDSRQLKAAYEQFISDYGFDPDNRLLFLFSGHGYSDPDEVTGYLVPADAPRPADDRRGFQRKALDMYQILAWSQRIKAKHALFLFDSCFSGTVFKARDLGDAAPPHISRFTAKPVRQFITAGDAGETVPAQSVFTPAFVDAIQGRGDLDRDGYVTGMELGYYLRREVPKYSRQNPQYGTQPNNYRLSRGDYVFVAGTGTGTGTATATADPRPPPGGTLVLHSRPAAAQVRIDGIMKGVTPLTLSDLRPGTVTVELALDGYRSHSRRVRVRAGRRTPLDLVLQPLAVDGGLTVTSTPPGAAWYLDGDYMGKTPDQAGGLKPGRHRLAVKKDGYRDWQGTVQVTAGARAAVAASLTEQVRDHALTVQVEPAGARVRIMNILSRYTPGIRLPPGRYHLRVDKAGYQRYDEWVELGERDRVVQVELEASAAEPRVRLRSRPTDLSERQAEAMFRQRGFFHSSWNKQGRFENRLVDNRDGTVTDRATGLMWQKGGSSESMYYADAKRYVARVNREGLAGHRDWRLPTLEEAASLLESEENAQGRHIDPVFDAEQRWVWTADFWGSGAVWFVLFSGGSADWLDTGDGNYVRLCRSAGQ